MNFSTCAPGRQYKNKNTCFSYNSLIKIANAYNRKIDSNDKIIFEDSGITQVGGDYRNFIFEAAGPIEIRFQNIVSAGTSGIESSVRGDVKNPIFRTVVFSTIVYDNSEKKSTAV